MITIMYDDAIELTYEHGKGWSCDDVVMRQVFDSTFDNDEVTVDVMFKNSKYFPEVHGIDAFALDSAYEVFGKLSIKKYDPDSIPEEIAGVLY